ncbi:MAG: hypothetical protein ABFC96_18330 [Thermoguttaceae bacterium]
MGLWKRLNSPIGCKMQWFEPLFFNARMRDQLQREMAILAVFAVAGVLGMLFLREISHNATFTVGIALSLGLLFGGSIGLHVAFRGNNSGATIRLRKRDIRRTSSRLFFFASWWMMEEETWPYASIQRCRIVHHTASGHRFSILEISTYSGGAQIGVPRNVDIRQLAKVLMAQGVSVQYRGAVAFEDIKAPVRRWWGRVAALAGLALLAMIGMTVVSGGTQRREVQSPPAAATCKPNWRQWRDGDAVKEAQELMRERAASSSSAEAGEADSSRHGQPPTWGPGGFGPPHGAPPGFGPRPGTPRDSDPTADEPSDSSPPAP